MEAQHNIIEKSLDVVIIGAGLAGLAAGIALRKQGHHVVILERSRFATETGAAIHMPPNCTALLEGLDIRPGEFGGTLLREIYRYNSLGDLQHSTDFTQIRREWQAEFYLVHRIDLHKQLKEAATSHAKIGTPVALHTGCKIVDIDCTTATVTLESGEKFSGDILLGADGVHSIIRSSVVGDLPQPKRVGKSCFRWLVPKAALLEQTATAKYATNPGVFIEWDGGDRRLVAYLCSDDTVMNLCAFVPSNEAGSNNGSNEYNAGGSKETLLKAFSHFSPSVTEIMEMAGDDLKAWELLDMESLPTWVKGRTVLIGDSAHPFQPYMGQGGAMAIEDAVSLATLLPLGTKIDEIPLRLQAYEYCRKPRTDQVMEYTRLNGRDANDTAGPRLTAAGMVEFMRFCFSHNERKFSHQKLEELNLPKPVSQAC